jgi:hypothetical protein
MRNDMASTRDHAGGCAPTASISSRMFEQLGYRSAGCSSGRIRWWPCWTTPAWRTVQEALAGMMRLCCSACAQRAA